jgi:hypothetical protein
MRWCPAGENPGQSTEIFIGSISEILSGESTSTFSYLGL